jgi:uncharacterized protein
VTAAGQAHGPAAEALELLDWKRRVHLLYAEVRAAADPAVAWARWRAVRDDLFARHPQSPLPPAARVGFGGLPVFPYDPGLRVLAEVADAPPARLEIAMSGEGTTLFTRCGVARFALGDSALALELYWLEAYGGGVFLPFADATSGRETYGAGRYLLDTVKGADLGTVDGRLVLDFNFAYHPSCAHDPRWACPLAPPANRLGVPVRGGERSA